MLQNVVGKEVSALPEWTQSWGRNGLIAIRDFQTINGVEVGKEPAWVKNLVTAGTLTITDANGHGLVDIGPFAQGGDKSGSAGEIAGAAVTWGSVHGTVHVA